MKLKCCSYIAAWISESGRVSSFNGFDVALDAGGRAPYISQMPKAPELADLYGRVRAATLELAAPLAPEDQVVQSMPDVSPTKWHLAHTSWFFETFVLRPGLAGYRPLDERYAYLFNSYYNAAGERIPQPQR